MSTPSTPPPLLDAEIAARIAAQVAAALARRARRRQDRDSLAARRDAGLTARHARKLDRKDRP
ncbi:hypothetical protein AWW66_11005 [Micromonospora rosaria]|uniref:Uncharacterized protein n=1 Tax=Micromonospora rosaria TaxID=47874 RepID=A0A136PTX8_9ACTN|nr:hypothetical protein [Micromonospora rosaria]KXK61961.1 hypothetical protein AWW66_11005 [Micromonospora rosaria]